MLKIKYLILVLSCTTVCLGAKPSISPIPYTTISPDPTTSNVTTLAPNTTSPATTITPSTSTPATNTTVTPSTTTSASNITTVTPSTTTSASNITTVTPSTTSVTPSTTTSSPSTTPVPTPSEPTIGTWSVNKSGIVCIVAQMALQVKITYKRNSNETKEVLINLPPANETTFDGVCGTGVNDTQNLIIKWKNNSLELTFAQNDTEKEFMLKNLNLTVQIADGFVGASLETPKFITPLSMSYKCDREETIKLVSSNVNDTILINVQHLQLEAFRKDNNTTKFSAAQECRTPTQDIVPIAVGCALALLVLIVLVAYLVGRNRVAARGYLSM